MTHTLFVPENPTQSSLRDWGIETTLFTSLMVFEN